MTDPDPLVTPAVADVPPAGNDRAAALVGAGILLSRLSGIIREVVLAAWLGATTVAAEAFAFALGVPKILQNLLGEGALSASFIPVYSQIVDDDPKAAKRLAGAVFGLLAALVGVLVLVLMVGAEPIVSVIARGAPEARADLIVELLRTMAPGIGFIVFAAWCLGILNAHREFFLSYVAPVLWNAAIVGAVVVWATQTDDLASIARAASWGVFIGGVAQFAVQLPRVLRIAGPITPSLDHRSAPAREVLRRFVPGVAGRGVVTLSTFIDLALSAFLAVGALAILAKAQTLYLMPISVFAISIAAADLPELSRESGNTSSAAVRVRRAVDRVGLFLVFFTIAFIVAGRSIVGFLFERGEFNSDDTIAVWLTLAVLAFGLLASGLSRIFQTASFANGDVGGPARIALVRLVIAASIGLLLMFPADRYQIIDGAISRTGDLEFGPLNEAERSVENAHRLGAVGLAAGSALAAWVELALLRRRLRTMSANLGLRSTFARLLPAGIAAAAVAGLLAWVCADLHPLLAAPIIVGPAAAFYVLTASRMGSATAAGVLEQLTTLSTSPRSSTRR